MESWAPWAEEARFFHFRTKDAAYVAGDPVQEMQLRRDAVESGGSRPDLFKSYPDAEKLYLPRSFVALDDSYGRVLLERRTHRNFLDETVDLRTFSTLMYMTFAPMMFCDADVFGTLAMKTSPSGGARHELEAYVVAFNVEGVPQGLYHYNAENHCLELLQATVDRSTVKELTYGMEMPGDSASCVS